MVAGQLCHRVDEQILLHTIASPGDLVAKLVRQSKFVFPCKIIEELRENAAKIKVGSVYPIAPAPESEEEPPSDSTVFFVYKMLSQR